MDLQVCRNVMAVLDIVGEKEEMPIEAKKDIEEFLNFFRNILADIDKELSKKDEVQLAKSKGKMYIYPLRLVI